MEFCILGQYVAEFYWTCKNTEILCAQITVIFKCFCFFLNPKRIFSMIIKKQKTV